MNVAVCCQQREVLAEKNGATLRAVESAMFVLSLDSSTPKVSLQPMSVRFHRIYQDCHKRSTLDKEAIALTRIHS